MNTSEILNKAADIVEQRGHSKGVYSDSTGRVCAVGAINAAILGTTKIEHLPIWYSGLDTHAGRVLHSLVCADEYWSITDWNDAPERTKEEVVAALRQAAEAVK